MHLSLLCIYLQKRQDMCLGPGLPFDILWKKDRVAGMKRGSPLFCLDKIALFVGPVFHEFLFTGDNLGVL